MELHLDYETASVVDLDTRGLDNYAKHPSTRVLMAAYTFGDGKPHLWEPHKGPLPADLRAAFEDPFCLVHSWNAQFERAITKYVLGIDIPIERWCDTMVQSRYLSMPGKLADAGPVIGLKPSLLKDKRGENLIGLFCSPANPGGEMTLFGLSEPSFYNWETRPKEWEIFGDYCKQDVIAERAFGQKADKFPVPYDEWINWFLCEKINETGFPVDMEFVNGAKKITEIEMSKLTKQLDEMTGLENPNSVKQLLPWLQERGYGFTSLGKAFVARAFAGECELTPEARQVLEIRSQTSKSSVKKYTALAEQVSEDGRLRNCYTFYGAARTGRYSAMGVNVGNLTKPTKQVEKNYDRAVELVRAADHDGIIREFGKPLEVVSSTVRSAFKAPPGFKFVVADLNAIENRCLGAIARCTGILNVFTDKYVYEGPDVTTHDGKLIRTGDTFPMDPYLSFGVKLYGQSYADLWYEWKVLGDSTKRNNSKPPVLGAGYQLGAGEELYKRECACGVEHTSPDPEQSRCKACGQFCKGGDKIWTGLMGYARGLGVEMSQEDAAYAIKIFRESYPEVVRFWRLIHEAAVYSVKYPGKDFGVGVPRTEKEEEYWLSKGFELHPPIITFHCTGKSVLEMKLPSGRSLHYINPIVEDEKREWNGRPFVSHLLSYEGKEVGSQTWGRVDTFGGKLTENVCQAISRDILTNGMRLADEAGFEIVGSTYDEIIALVPEDSPLGVKELCDCMTARPDWLWFDFPLAAEGFEDFVYRKN